MKKIFRKYEFKRSNRRFLIEEDLPEVGWYLYVFDESGKCVADQLQDSIDIIMEIAKDNYNIPKESWRLIK